jgi:hypothetical membrane protein
MRKVLLCCGAFSSLVYVLTDILGGLRYPGYSFASQGVSELMAIGAPSRGLVDPLFIVYDVLAVAFGIGVVREAAERNPQLRRSGLLLVVYALAGMLGPTVFPMHQRGTGSFASDTPHIVLTAVLVIFMFLAIGFAALALDKRFRVYSFATILVLVVFGAIAGAYGGRLAAQQPTPGLGIFERISIYSYLLWVAVLALTLWRQPESATKGAYGTR